MPLNSENIEAFAADGRIPVERKRTLLHSFLSGCRDGGAPAEELVERIAHAIESLKQPVLQ